MQREVRYAEFAYVLFQEPFAAFLFGPVQQYLQEYVRVHQEGHRHSKARC